MAKTATTTAIAENISFEQAMSELESIVRKLESGTADLESTISDYERGMALKSHCEAKLNQARLKVESIVNKDGSTSAVPFDIKE